MNKRVLLNILFLALIGQSFSAFAQEDKKETKRIDEWMPIINKSAFKFKHRKDKFYGHWSGFEMGINAFVTKNNDIELKEAENKFLRTKHLKSWCFAFNPVRYSIPISKPNFGLVTGLGFEWNNYGFENNFNFVEVDGVMTPSEVDKDLYQNRLNLLYLNVPLIIELQFPRYAKNRVHIGIGATGGLLLHASQKQAWHEGDQHHKKIQSGGLNINQFRYGLTLRAGYSYFHVFANYNFSPLFAEDKGPELFPISVGIVLINI